MFLENVLSYNHKGLVCNFYPFCVNIFIPRDSVVLIQTSDKKSKIIEL